MFHLNKVMLSGTLTRDPEVKFTTKGTAIADFSLAINRTWKDEQGNKKEEVTFIDCTAFGGTAKILGDWCKKGHTIFIEGRLRMEQWTDKQSGQKRQKLSVIAETMNFVTKPKGEEEPSPPLKDQPSKPATRPPQQDPDLDPVPEDDVPF